MLLALILSCSSDEPVQKQKFMYENEQTATWSARVSDSDGVAVTGAILAIQASNSSGGSEGIARGVSTADGTARIRAVIPSAWSSPRLVVLHPDYEIASTGISGWSEEEGWDDDISVVLTPK